MAVISGDKKSVSRRSLLTMEVGRQTLKMKGEFRVVGQFIHRAIQAVPECSGRIGLVRWLVGEIRQQSATGFLIS